MHILQAVRKRNTIQILHLYTINSIISKRVYAVLNDTKGECLYMHEYSQNALIEKMTLFRLSVHENISSSFPR